MSALTLTIASATCPKCGFKVSQIDQRERAVAVVTEGMNKHMAEHHHEDAPEAGES